MKEQLVTFETAKLAKEKGFDELCSFTYSLPHEQKFSIELSKSGLLKEYKKCKNSEFTICVTVPPQSLLQKWLREEHQISVFTIPFFDKMKWHTKILYDEYNIDEGITCNTFEESLEKGLMEALKKIN